LTGTYTVQLTCCGHAVYFRFVVICRTAIVQYVVAGLQQSHNNSQLMEFGG